MFAYLSQMKTINKRPKTSEVNMGVINFGSSPQEQEIGEVRVKKTQDFCFYLDLEWTILESRTVFISFF